MMQAAQRKLVPAHAVIEPFGNAGDSGRAEAGFISNTRVGDIFVQHLGGLPAVAEFYKLSFG